MAYCLSSLFFAFAATLSAVGGARSSSCPSGCPSDPVSGFVQRQGESLVDDDGEPFRFVSVNVPNLHRIEADLASAVPAGAASFPLGNVRARVPTEAEVRDALCSVRQLGARATRLHVLSHGDTDAFHVGPGGELNEVWFQALDIVLAAAHDLGVRLIIPFVDTLFTEFWGSTRSYASWVNESESEFFHSGKQQDLFKAVVGRILRRNNTVTGRIYAEEEAILAWELGNDLFDVTYGGLATSVPVPTAWTSDLAQFVKAIDQNHLLMDGSQFTLSSLGVADVDIVGSIFLGKTAVDAAEEMSALHAYNQAVEEMDRKAYIVKAFGLVESGSWLPPQDFALVSNMIEVVHLHPHSVAGAMYSSLSYHAHEGGFYHVHGYGVADLHWPGFLSGASNYEIEVLGELAEAARNASGDSESILKQPCPPELLVQAYAGVMPGGACLPFRGSAGAAQYELWAARGTGGAEKDWRLISEGISDETTAQNAVVGVHQDMLQMILGGGGTDGSQTYSFCLRSCAGRGQLRDESRADYRRIVPDSCSNCSEPVQVQVAWGGSLDCPSSASGEVKFYGEEFALDAWESGFYDYGGAPPEIKLVLVVLGVVAAVILVDLLSRHGSRGSKAPTPAECVSQLRGDSGNRAGVVDLLRFAASLHLVFYLGAKYKWFGPVPDVLSGLAAWGVVEFPFLFLHAGFVAGVRYTPRASGLDVWPFVWRFLARTYPVFLVFAAATLIYAAIGLGLPITGRHIWIFPFNVHAWNADLQFNDMTAEVSWVLGPLVVYRVLSLPLLSRFQEISKSALFTILVAACALTLWQAVYYREVRVFVLDDVVTWLALRAFGPSFVMGAAMGALFGMHYGGEGMQMQSIGKVKEAHQVSRIGALHSALVLVLERFGVSLSVILLSIVGAFARGPASLSGWPLAQTWVGHGLTLPLQAVMLWAAAAGTDPIAAVVLHRVARLLTLLQSWLWFHLLLAGPITQALTTHLLDQAEYSPGERILLFGAVLLVVASKTEIVIRQPAIAWAEQNQPNAGKLGLVPSWAGAPTNRELLFLYYAGLAAVLVTFAWYALEEESVWISVVNIPDGPVATVLLVVTYMLFIPAMALGMGLMGMVMYPPILDRKAAPIKRQLQEDHLEDKSRFRIAFRIVTRGNSPNLVKANVCVAHEVLDNCDLPKDRWLLEVVTDAKMDLETLGLPVAELVVPKSFKPPGGGMFKARALQFAVGASSATREDWVVHLDEETRFDAETVASVLEHCREQQAAWEAQKQGYPHIGQGVIVYNTTCQENLLCTLADTIRVSDDFGKFAMQYRLFEQPLIGMHGSFVVCPNSVEIDVGFDWGLAGSITEDTFFALKAAGDGIHVKWCGGHMFEQSPFGVHDFAKQRCRWFAGLWLCVRDRRLPLLHRVVLGSHVVSWALCPFLTILAWTNWLCRMTRPGWMRVTLALIYAIPLWGYLLGFFWTFAMSTFRHGPAEYLMLLFMQIMGVPIYALMEAYGVALALWTRPFKKFQLVQKEGKLATGGASSAVAAAAAAAEAHEATTEAVEEADEAGKVDKEQAADARPSRDHSFHLHKHARRTSRISSLSVSHGASPDQAFWHHVLADAPCMLQVPSTCATPVTPRPGKKRAALPEGSADALMKLAAASAQGTSVLDIAGAAFTVVLATHCQEEDFVLGAHSHLSRQVRFEEEAVMLPVRVPVDFDKSLPELSRVFSERRRSSELNHTQDGFPSLGSILCQGGESWTEWAASSRPAFCFGVAAANKQALPQVDVVLRVSTSEQAKAEGYAEAVLEFSTNAYDEGILLQLCSRIGQLLISASTDLQQPLCRVPMLTEEEAIAVAGFIGQTKPYRKQPLHELFLAQAALRPEAVAATHWSTSITYGALSSAVQRVAVGVRFLIGGSVRVETGNVLVGLLFERTVDSLAVVYGVIAAGAAYLPMDPDFPVTRIKNILLDAREACPLVLVEGEELALKVPTEYPGKVACASCEGVKFSGGAVAPALGTSGTEFVVASESMVYCMYTSGTTGRPKGVMVDHDCLSIRIDWFQAEFGISAAERLIFKTPYIFGISEWEIFWPLSCGASLAVAPKEVVRSLTLLTELMQSQRVSHAFFVPSHLWALLRHWRNLPTLGLRKTLRWIGCCGEALPEQTIMDTYRVLPRVELHNIYGPTEGSMTWRHCEWQDASETATLIGKPIDNTVVVLLDRWQRLVPVGVPGEICFGHCVAKGYLNKPGLTKEKFVPSQLPEGFLPAGAPACPLLYHTGDVAIWLETGELKYVGRADRQVKVRGFRIELGAVEGAMREAAALASARLKQQQPLVCSVALPPAAGRPSGELVGFIEASLSRSEIDELRRHMSELLPSYMVPTRLIAKCEFETLPSGKVNIKSLEREAAGELGVEEAGKGWPVEATTQAEDSLGTMRRVMGSTSSRAMEDRVADNLRAFFMYGVIFDHWVGCAENTTCQLVVDGMIWQQAPGVQSSLSNLEVILRSLGNYKTMSGFIMLSAYADAAYADAAYFSKRDLVVLLAYLQLLWVCDPIIWALCRVGQPDRCTETTNHYAGIHRWYLLVVLVIKIALVFFRITRIPPLAQCALLTGLAFCMPSEFGCFTEDKCAAKHDSEFWIENHALFGPVWTVIFRGLADDPHGTSTSAFNRYYVFYMALYFWTFHNGRMVVAKATEALQFFAPTPGDPNCNKWWTGLSAVALLLFVLLELCSSAIIGPQLNGIVQGNAFGTSEPRLLPLLMVAALLVVEVALVAFAASAVPWRLRLLGSTTLGCYMIHTYFSYPIVLLREHFDNLGQLGGGGLILQAIIILVAPLVFQATIGATFHKLFMWEFSSLVWAAAWIMQLISHSCQRLLKSMGFRRIEEVRDLRDLALTPASAGGSAAWDAWKPDANAVVVEQHAQESANELTLADITMQLEGAHTDEHNAELDAKTQAAQQKHTRNSISRLFGCWPARSGLMM